MAQSLQASGIEVVPVPVYYPDVQTILGQPVLRKLSDIPGPVDIVDVFRRAEDLEPHLEDILSIKPKVWARILMHACPLPCSLLIKIVRVDLSREAAGSDLSVHMQVVWLQSGISDRRFEEQVAKAGILVVPDRCLKVDRERAVARL